MHAIDRTSTTPTLTADQELLARLQAGDERALGRSRRRLQLEDLPACLPLPPQQGRRRGDHAGRAVQGVPEGGRVPRRRALSSWIYRITFNAAMSRLRTARYQRAQAEDRRAAAAADEDGSNVAARTPDVADWSDMADERVLRSQLRQRRVQRDSGAAGDLPRAGDAARHPGDVDRGSERDAAREGSDAEVAAAPRPSDSAQAAGRLRRRPHAAPTGLRDALRRADRGSRGDRSR